MKNSRYKSPLFLLSAALIWGFAFSGLRIGLDQVPTFTFNCIRSIFACIFLSFLLLIREFVNKKHHITLQFDKKKQIVAGLTCGSCVYISGLLQQIGIQYTTVGKSGFIMGLYIILVPIFGYLFFHKTLSFMNVISVLLATMGFYLLTIGNSLSINVGDVLMLLSSGLFAIDILLVSYYSNQIDGILLSFQQFVLSACISGVMMVFEPFRFQSIYEAMPAIFYVGTISCGVGYTLQILGQKNCNEVLASLLLSLESVFAAIGGWILFDESLKQRELIGCVIILIAIVLAEFTGRRI